MNACQWRHLDSDAVWIGLEAHTATTTKGEAVTFSKELVEEKNKKLKPGNGLFY